MKAEWLHKNNRAELILFFNGWGMDSCVVSHLHGNEYDILSIHDYSSLSTAEIPELNGYRHIILIAWSMGVWAAENVVGRLDVVPERCIALNGTGSPVDNENGIPEQIYLLTENGLDEKGREKFFFRMHQSRKERERFKTMMPRRILAEQVEELRRIREQSRIYQNHIHWDKAYISENDIIFPVVNQLNYWQGKAEITMLKSGHNPFLCFNGWSEMV